MSQFGGFLVVAIVGWRCLSIVVLFCTGCCCCLSLFLFSSTSSHITRIQIYICSSKGPFPSPPLSRQTSSATATQLGRRWGSSDHGKNLLPQRFRRGTLTTANASRRGMTGGNSGRRCCRCGGEGEFQRQKMGRRGRIDTRLADATAKRKESRCRC
jgi:hypothetical protein